MVKPPRRTLPAFVEVVSKASPVRLLSPKLFLFAAARVGSHPAGTQKAENFRARRKWPSGRRGPQAATISRP